MAREELFTHVLFLYEALLGWFEVRGKTYVHYYGDGLNRNCVCVSSIIGAVETPCKLEVFQARPDPKKINQTTAIKPCRSNKRD